MPLLLYLWNKAMILSLCGHFALLLFSYVTYDILSDWLFNIILLLGKFNLSL